MLFFRRWDVSLSRWVCYSVDKALNTAQGPKLRAIIGNPRRRQPAEYTHDGKQACSIYYTKA
jgi:hypothetical protein